MSESAAERGAEQDAKLSAKGPTSTALQYAAAFARSVQDYAERYSPARLIEFSKLTSKIVLLTLLALVIQIIGVMYVSEYRKGLIELKLAFLRSQAEVLAVTIADVAIDSENDRSYDRVVANELLRRLALQIGLRAQLYDRSGRLNGDTRKMLSSSIMIEDDFTPVREPGRGALGMMATLGRYTISSFTQSLPLYRETPPAGITQDEEVYKALAGREATAERVNSEDELILSVAVPVKRVRTVMGALVLSTEGGDITELAWRAYWAIIQWFAVALIVTLLLSVALAHTVARPIRQLSQAAEDGRKREKAPLDPGRIDIPDLSGRGDEIGDLSTALRRMTEALYQRIDAIESFAADVAHEIKNPLTSMRSAVESFHNAKNDDQRKRLLEVIQHDVGRMDRLVTEISNASRLDSELVRQQRCEFDLTQLLRNVIGICESICDGQDLTITFDTRFDASRVEGIEDRLAQVFHNLLDNAASFSPEGGSINVKLSKTTLDGSNAWLVEVIDEGPGIPPENLESVFRRFYSERPEAHEFGKHSGLGLAICRQIVEAHGGRIWCDNRGDASGAVFSVVLPQ